MVTVTLLFNWSVFPIVISEVTGLYNKKDYEAVTTFIEDYTKDLEDVFVSFRKLLTNPIDQFREIAFLGRVAVLFPLIIQAFRKDKSDGKISYNQFMTILS